MLDDLKLIHERDPQDALGLAEKQWQQLAYVFKTPNPNFQGIKNVVLSGMGGSALPGVFLQAWPGLSVPFEISRSYSAPAYADSSTLFISSSYSGNTEETLSALDDAEKRGCMVAVITAGGKLLAEAQAKSYPVFTIPSGIQPRMSSFYFLSALIQLLEGLGLVEQGKQAELQQTADWLKSQTATWQPDVPTGSNLPKQIAQELMGKTVIMYSGPHLFPAANKWKICFNESAKNLAWANQYSEFNHNEFMGWTSHPVNKPFAVVEIRSQLEHPRIQKRFEVTERLLSGKRPAPIVVKPEGASVLQQLIWSSVLGDFTSIYLAFLNNVNPTPVELVEKLKMLLDS
jgi:glucose/mannose-6-phosphate isomerase